MSSKYTLAFLEKYPNVAHFTVDIKEYGAHVNPVNTHHFEPDWVFEMPRSVRCSNPSCGKGEATILDVLTEAADEKKTHHEVVKDCNKKERMGRDCLHVFEILVSISYRNED